MILRFLVVTFSAECPADSVYIMIRHSLFLPDGYILSRRRKPRIPTFAAYQQAVDGQVGIWNLIASARYAYDNL